MTEQDSPEAQKARIGGTDRIGTSVETFLRGNYPGNSVVLAVSTDFADATAGGPLAKALGAPVLLTGGAHLERSVQDAIVKRNKKEVFILGGEDAISAQLADEVRKLGLTVTRLGGVNRYQTATLVAAAAIDRFAKQGKQSTGVYVATGKLFPDAIAVGALAARNNGVVVFSRGDELEKYTTEFLAQRTQALGKAPALTAAGGPAQRALSAAGKPATALAGADRYETAAKVAMGAAGATTGVLINGTTFADSLAGGAFAADQNGVVLLSRTADLPKVTEEVISKQIKKLYALGGVKAITPNVLNRAVAAIK